MRIDQYAPAAITILSAVASVVCFCAGDWRKGLYWCGATLIGIALTA